METTPVCTSPIMDCRTGCRTARIQRGVPSQRYTRGDQAENRVSSQHTIHLSTRPYTKVHIEHGGSPVSRQALGPPLGSCLPSDMIPAYTPIICHHSHLSRAMQRIQKMTHIHTVIRICATLHSTFALRCLLAEGGLRVEAQTTGVCTCSMLVMRAEYRLDLGLELSS